MSQVENRVEKLFKTILGGASVRTTQGERDNIVELEVNLAGAGRRLRVAWAGEGWPADVQRALQAVPDPSPWPDDLVLVARHLSPGSIELLRKRDANWADEAGQARIAGPGLLVVREPTEQHKREPTLSWSPSALAIGEALLSKEWPEGIGTSELASLTGWSPPQVSDVLSKFDARGWTAKFGPRRGPRASREIADAEGLLSEWATAVAGQDFEQRLVHRTLRDPMRFLQDELAPSLDEHARWALTGWGAADVLAPLISRVPSLQIYVHGDDFVGPLDAVIEKLELADVSEGAAIEFRAAPPGALALSHSHGGLRLASPPRVYADLLSLGGRGEDAAAHLKEEIMDPGFRAGGAKEPPSGLVSWERECHRRLEELVSAEPSTDLKERCAHGIWSVAYRLIGSGYEPSSQRFLAVLREIQGGVTEWIPWWIPDRPGAKPHPIDGLIECWLSDTAFGDAAHFDFWRADPSGRLCLIRGYEEDSAPQEIAPGRALDPTLQIRGMGECLLHADRLAHRLGAQSVQFMVRWTGLEGRTLRAWASRDRVLPGEYSCTQQEVVSFLGVRSDRIAEDLASLVRELVEPLYAAFDFFEPPEQIYAEELDKMREGAR